MTLLQQRSLSTAPLTIWIYRVKIQLLIKKGSFLPSLIIIYPRKSLLSIFNLFPINQIPFQLIIPKYNCSIMRCFLCHSEILQEERSSAWETMRRENRRVAAGSFSDDPPPKPQRPSNNIAGKLNHRNVRLIFLRVIFTTSYMYVLQYTFLLRTFNII